MAHEEITVAVSGMSCEHCVKSITEAVQALEGVEDVKVDLSGGSVSCRLTDESVTRADVVEAIEEAGYEAAKGD